MLLFVRHGETFSNKNNTFSGRRDPADLTDEGISQANEAGRTLHMKPDRIVASSLHRARHTAEIIAAEIGFDPSHIETEPRLDEYDMGLLSGKSRARITSAQLIAAEEAEDPFAFQARVMAAIDELRAFNGTVLVVAHAGVGRTIEAFRTGSDPAGFYDLPAYPNGKVIELLERP